MPYHIFPLRYAIDDWHQAANAKSNTDPTLKIKVTDFSNSDIFAGIRLQVWHPQYGVLFSCIPVAYGRMISDVNEAGLTTDQIISALRQLGFSIQFKTNPKLNAATRSYLADAMGAGYTHVRWAVKKIVLRDPKCLQAEVPKTKRIVICFNENKRPDLLKQVIPPIINFGGDVMQVSPDNNPNLDFTWLDLPVLISSVLTDNY